MHALLLGLLLGLVLAVLLAVLAVAGRASVVAADGPLFRKLLLLTPVWLIAIAYVWLARVSRTRTRVVASIVCAVVACVVAFGLAVLVPSMLYF